MTGAVRSLDLMAAIGRNCAVIVVGELHVGDVVV